MTREEAKKEIIDMANALQLIPNTPKGKAVSMALKALEQEPVLDKIKAEIRQQQWYLGVDNVNQVIEIIDKHINHKAESEVLNGREE